jgi:hypothetical protein
VAIVPLNKQKTCLGSIFSGKYILSLFEYAKAFSDFYLFLWHYLCGKSILKKIIF